MTVWQRIKKLLGWKPSMRTYVDPQGNGQLMAKKRKQMPMDTDHYMQPYAIPVTPVKLQGMIKRPIQ